MAYSKRTEAGRQSGERPPDGRHTLGSEGIANRRPHQSGITNVARPGRRRWSPLAMTAETARALPVVIPVGIIGTVGIVTAIVSLALDPPGWATLAGVAGLLAGVVAGQVRGDTLGAIVAGACLGAAAFYFVDMVFLSAVVARTRGTNFIESLGRYLYSTTLPFLVIASLIVTLIVLWNRSPFISVVVLGPLVTVALHERWLHRALERLREFDRLKDEFIAVISHELRTPLTSVYGAALTLQKRDVSAEMQEALLDIVSDEAGRLARLLDDALSASRLHADRETFEITTIDGAGVARSVVDAIRPRVPEGLELELIESTGVPLVAADPDKLRQVLVNLTENAIKYSPNGGRIEVRVDRIGPAVRFSVRDEGIGIAPEEQRRVFERFHRLDPNMTRGVGGTGLGLYICRELVQHMGGRIWVTSREGRGSTFSFDLPPS